MSNDKASAMAQKLGGYCLIALGMYQYVGDVWPVFVVIGLGLVATVNIEVNGES